jgi:hypothetical protein
MTHHPVKYHSIKSHVGALCAGFLMGAGVNMSFLYLNTQYFYPLPEGVTMDDAEAFPEYIRTLPAAGYILVLAAHLGQVLTGSVVAAQLCPAAAVRQVYWITALTFLGSVANNFMLRHVIPLWTWGELPLYLVLGWYLGRQYASCGDAVPRKSHSQ